MIIINKRIVHRCIFHVAEIWVKQTDLVDEVNLYMKSTNKSHLTDFTDGMCEQN